MYRYSFEGQEHDDEIKGQGNILNFTYRVYDPRLGRFLSVDPLTKGYPHWSPYQFAGNQVIKSKELEGLEPEVDLTGQFQARWIIGQKNSFRLGATATPSITGKNFQVKSDFSFGIYSGGLGTSSQVGTLQFDFTASLSGTLGGGKGEPLPQYTLNSNTASAVNNEFNWSISYGQMFNYNSATNSVTRNALVNGRIPTGFGGIAFSSSNDTKGFPYIGGGTDQAWTGSLVASWRTKAFGITEVGFDDFTGKALERGEKSRTTVIGGRPYYQQTADQASLNKASTFIRIPSAGLTFDFMNDGWLQHTIHDTQGVGMKGLWKPDITKQTPRFMYLNPGAVVVPE